MLKEPATIVKSLDKPLTSSISFQISRKVVMALLSQLSHAGLTVTEPNGEQLFFGDKSSDLQAQLTIHNQSFYKRLLQGEALRQVKRILITGGNPQCYRCYSSIGS